MGGTWSEKRWGRFKTYHTISNRRLVPDHPMPRRKMVDIQLAVDILMKKRMSEIRYQTPDSSSQIYVLRSEF
jgi:hypothetical protein